MQRPDVRPRGSALALMTLVAVWAGLLAAGLAWAAFTAPERLGPGRTLLFWIGAGFLLLLSTRTAYELLRHLRRR